MSKRKQRTTQSYLESVRRNAELVPALRQYRRRKTLNRGEKAVIRKAEIEIAKAGRQRLRPVTDRQIRAMDRDSRKAVVGSSRGGGPRIRAVSGPPGSNVTVRNGQVRYEKAGQRFATATFNSRVPEFDEILQTVKKVRRRLRAFGPVDFKLWQLHGFTEPAGLFGPFEDDVFAQLILDMLNRYMAERIEKSDSLFIFGIAGTKPNAGK